MKPAISLLVAIVFAVGLAGCKDAPEKAAAPPPITTYGDGAGVSITQSAVNSPNSNIVQGDHQSQGLIFYSYSGAGFRITPNHPNKPCVIDWNSIHNCSVMSLDTK